MPRTGWDMMTRKVGGSFPAGYRPRSKGASHKIKRPRESCLFAQCGYLFLPLAFLGGVFFAAGLALGLAAGFFAGGFSGLAGFAGGAGLGAASGFAAAGFPLISGFAVTTGGAAG